LNGFGDEVPAASCMDKKQYIRIMWRDIIRQDPLHLQKLLPNSAMRLKGSWDLLGLDWRRLL